MRLVGRKKGHCHSLAVGHGMRCDETGAQKKGALSLTSCWSWDEMCWADKGAPSLTYCLLVMG
jgi:hypothetical protein